MVSLDTATSPAQQTPRNPPSAYPSSPAPPPPHTKPKELMHKKKPGGDMPSKGQQARTSRRPPAIFLRRPPASRSDQMSMNNFENGWGKNGEKNGEK